ncbi:cytochrome b pre-mRNA-processing protein 3 [Devosia enhydra]|uniref:Cytochrome b pre-mRNA-processing protein 3 n=1 Tax=Devosia enhydra TaxID=665118 RepID=A0A1K2HUS5_9HYPH|nr:ubiquinol-cytochrome C chaperone family protein [Devosia enhydra]SFZ81353.1 cytochrome b pre-mRNA-processing protein 3 [Devosia enhydra]
MIFDFMRKRRNSDAVYAVYRAIVAQSRRPQFYAEWGVPDTVTGRFDMISLHLALLFKRCARESDASREFSQEVFDLFFKDMDRSLREMGAGDLAVPKKVKTMSSIFFGLVDKVTRAIDANDADQLAEVLSRNILGGEGAAGALPMAHYVIDQHRRLSQQPVETILSGQIDFEGEPA